MPLLLLLAMLPGLLPGPQMPLHDFENPSLWRLNADGGGGVRVETDAATTRRGRAMRIVYADRPPHWGNLVGPCRVPPDATALRFWIYKHRSAPQAAMYVWLLEPDGDAWVQPLLAGGTSIGALRPGWQAVRLPVAAFSFEPRGKGTRAMPGADRMLIGCNYGDLEVTVDEMFWETREGAPNVSLPRTAGLKTARGPRGSVGVLDMGVGLPDGFRTAHPPRQMASALRAAGFGATVLKAGDMADPKVLTRRNFDAVVLPFGPYFPAAAREPFLAYLKAGGSFLSTDGYAFDRLMAWDGRRWIEQMSGVTAAETAQPPASAEPMNTRRGQPGDAMTFRPEQIGVFDPAFRLEGAARLRAAGTWADLSPGPSPTRGGEAASRGEGVSGRGVRVSGAPITGYAACGLLGDNSPVFPPVYRRWTPVLVATDAQGALRGPALALMHNFDGPFKGSAWAFSGLTSGHDLFLGTPARRRLLAAVMGTLTNPVTLHGLETDHACYRPGETATVRGRVTNSGRAAQAVELTLTVGGKREQARRFTLKPGETRTVEARRALTAGTPDFVPVAATLRRAGLPDDTAETAFCVWNAKVIAKGPKIGWKDNNMTLNGRPQFMIGTNQTGMMFYSANENPAVWDADFRRMAQNHVRLVRILHFSPFAKDGYKGGAAHSSLDLANRPDKLCRQMDAIVQIAQKHGVAIFLTLHDWLNIGLTDEELRAQADWNRFWTARYRDVPGIFYDVQNEPAVDVPDRPDMRALWNDWLRARYGSEAGLRAAWHRTPPEAAMPDVPLAGGTEAWDDVRTADRKRFEAEVLNRWVRANVEGAKSGDPDALMLVGYLPSMPPADKMLGTRHTDISNMHYYGPVEGFPLEIKLIDRRFAGKGFSLGEFGAQEAHDARIRGEDGQPSAVSVRRFDAVLHYAAGLGAAFVANWDWKEFDEMVFPWGLWQRNMPVPKPWLKTYARGAAFLARVRPAYESPQVFLLAPDRHRIGPRFNDLHGALQRAVELLLDARVDFGVINEEDLAKLPASAKALVWPLPYCPDDATFTFVEAWVKAGGALYLSGDVAFDPARQPTRRARRAALGLPDDFAPVSPFNAPETAWDRPPFDIQIGRGRVLFAPYPLELRRRESDRSVYALFLQLAGIRPHRLEPDSAPVRVMSVPTQEGGRLYSLVRTDDGEQPLTVRLADANARVTLGPGGCAFVVTDSAGRMIAGEGAAPAR